MSLLHNNKKGFQLQEYANITTEPIADKGILLCTTHCEYISETEFKRYFHELGKYIQQCNIEKLIFDKRSLKVFDQPSMEWYHVVWKKEMAAYGLKSYRKILPDDKLFIQSVEIGRAKILAKYPEFHFYEYDIQYFDSVKEAIEN